MLSVRHLTWVCHKTASPVNWYRWSLSGPHSLLSALPLPYGWTLCAKQAPRKSPLSSNGRVMFGAPSSFLWISWTQPLTRQQHLPMSLRTNARGFSVTSSSCSTTQDSALVLRSLPSRHIHATATRGNPSWTEGIWLPTHTPIDPQGPQQRHLTCLEIRVPIRHGMVVITSRRPCEGMTGHRAPSLSGMPASLGG